MTDLNTERLRAVEALFAPGGDYEPCPQHRGCEHAECEVAYAVQMELGVIPVMVSVSEIEEASPGARR